MEDLLSESSPHQEKHRISRASIALLFLALPTIGRRLALLSAFVFLIATFLLLVRVSDRLLIEIPEKGGMVTEGIIGRPRFVNPIIAKSDADRDLAELIYSGLLRAEGNDSFVTDLASSYDISEDGLTYTFKLRNDLVWHDGQSVTSADVAFTIEKVKDQSLPIKSPRRASWEGVAVDTPDPLTVVFHIKQPYVAFLENATMGIPSY